MSIQQLDAILEQLAATPILDLQSVQARREGFEQIAAAFPVAADVACEPVQVGGMKAEWVTAPGAAADRAILYLHGGGYEIGSINTHRDLASRISRAAQARVLLIDYRLAPENAHPAAVDDATAAYRWLLAQGIAPKRLAIAGDSAGGGLTIASLVALKDARQPLPACAVALSPWVDLEGIGESMTSKASIDPIIRKENILTFAANYLGGKSARTPLAAPLYADLAGLPPLLIQVGVRETLFDDATRLAERARKSGVDVTLEPWEDMVHVWHLFAPLLDEGQQAIDRIGAYVRTHVA